MPRRLKDFNIKDKIKCLQWCQRHCCLCEKNCGMDIEIAHISANKKIGVNKIENAIPLCYECHAKTGHYNSIHPRGNKYTEKELIASRDQIYEKYTRHLVPPIDFKMTQTIPGTTLKRQFPLLGFEINHIGNTLPVRVLVNLVMFLGNNKLATLGGLYGEQIHWNLNPHTIFNLPITASKQIQNSDKWLKIKIYIKVIDQYERQHQLLPMTFIYNKNDNEWWPDPQG